MEIICNVCNIYSSHSFTDIGEQGNANKVTFVLLQDMVREQEIEMKQQLSNVRIQKNVL
jgi:hypothetical protein